jgi:peroxiredoxin
MALQIGDRAPDISAGAFRLSQLRGKRVVVFFFPKADTPG